MAGDMRPVRGDCVFTDVVGHRVVEVRVGDRNVRKIRKRLLRAPKRVEGGLVVKGCDLRSLLDVKDQPVFDELRLDEQVAEVDDSMSDGVGVDEVVHHRRGAFVDEGELQARRTQR